MIAYRKERIENALLFFAQEHYKLTGEYLTVPALHKYLMLYEFKYLKKTGDQPLELKYFIPEPPVAVDVEDDLTGYRSVQFEPYRLKERTISVVKPRGVFDPDYFAEAEIELMGKLVFRFGKEFTAENIGSDSSHTKVKAWKKANSAEKTAEKPIPYLNPDAEFEDSEKKSENDLTNAEFKYRINKNMRNFCLTKKTA